RTRTRLSVRYRPGERSVLSSVLKLWNESRTNRARIADSILSEFVHGDIWWYGLCTPQNRVRGRQSRSRPMLKSINGNAHPSNSEDCRGAGTASCRTPLLRFCRRLARLRHGKELSGLHDPEPERGRNRGPIGHHHACARNRGKPELHIAQLHEILDRVALGNVPRDRRKAHRTDHGHALVAPLRPHPLEPLEGELEVIAHAAVEDRQRALASLGNEGVAAAWDPDQRRGHRVRHSAAVSIGDRNAIRARNGR